MKMAVDLVKDQFSPFNKVFEHFDDDEKNHIHNLLTRYRFLERSIDLHGDEFSTNGTIRSNLEKDALKWVLVILKDLEDIEEGGD